MGIFIFIVVLATLILVHECGHFFMARLWHVGVDEFGIGFPPRLFGFTFRPFHILRRGVLAPAPATTYTVNALPFGGFVRLRGEEKLPVAARGNQSYFANRSTGVRISIAIAGVVMNLVMAVILLTMGALIGVPAVMDKPLPVPAIAGPTVWYISGVEIDSPAALAGLVAGDRIEAMNHQAFTSIVELRRSLVTTLNHSVLLSIVRRGESRAITVNGVPGPRGVRIGVELMPVAYVRYTPRVAIKIGTTETYRIARDTVSFFGTTLRRLFSGGGVPRELTGPVGIASMTSDVLHTGWSSLLPFAALLSVNLAVINSLPIPALDGGRIFFILIELIRRRRVEVRHEQVIHTVGFVALLGLVLLVTYRDIIRIIAS